MQVQLLTGRHQRVHREALIAGLNRHNALKLLPRAMAVWGWRSGRRYQKHGVLVLERGYIGDRFSWTSIGWNGLNGRATFPEYPDDGGERFRRMGSLKPWNPSGDYALIVGQVTGDMALMGKNLYPWYLQKALEAQEVYGVPAVFRPHPMEVHRGRANDLPGIETNKGPLDEALDGARVVVTFNSNTGVDAMLAGKPTIAHDIGSMAWSVAAHDIGGDCDVAGREAWAHSLAWKQWTLEEIRSGDALAGVVERMRG